ncbi:MAG: ATP-binding protein [Myxococcota bacterium]
MSESLILYVDDEKPNRVVFQQSFAKRFRILVAASGAEALEVLEREAVGVLVTDQRMPDMPGNDLLNIAKEKYPNVIRVIVTAYSDLDPILRAVNEGLVARYIIKPWDRAELDKVLTWAVEAHQLAQEGSALHLRLMETERLVTLGSIGAAVIHDINQPLSYLTTNSERLGQLAVSIPVLRQLLTAPTSSVSDADRRNLMDLTDELPEIVSDMLEGCRLMHGITASIRRLLRPTGDAEPRECDPSPVVRYALSVVRGIAMKARAQVLYDGPNELPRIMMGTTELNQTLINLLSNAAQAMQRRDGGGRVTLTTAHDQSMLRFVVRDDGPGMPAAVLAKVGTPFFSTRPDGTGLGVAQCRRLVEREGGELHIESLEGTGTTVSFTVPLAGH